MVAQVEVDMEAVDVATEVDADVDSMVNKANKAIIFIKLWAMMIITCMMSPLT